MNLVSKSILAAVTGTFVLASAALGEEVKAADVAATKVSPIKAALPDSFGKVELRHYANYNMTDDEVKGVTPKAQVRAYLGSNFMNDKISSQLILAGTKSTETTQIKQRNPEWYTEVEALSGTYGSINPYADIYLPFQGSGTVGSLSLDSTLKLPTIELAMGKLELATGIDPNVTLTSRPSKTTNVDVKTSREATLLTKNEEGATEVTQKEPSFGAEARASIGFKPAAVAGLGLTVATYVARTFDPAYEVVEEGNDTVQNKTGYVVENTTSQKLAISYKISDNLSFVNKTWHKMNGAYAARYDGGIAGDGLSRVTNIVKLNYTLF